MNIVKIKVLTASLVVIGIFVGLVISFQIFTPKTPIENPWETVEELQDTIQILNSSHQGLRSRIADLRTQIETYEAMTIDQATQERLEEAKKSIGLTEIQGAGIRVALDINMENYLESSSGNNYCFAAELRDIVNLLRASDAEAISINGQRIISSTPIACFGSSVLINNLRYLPPYTINAVGEDQNKLISYLDTKKYLPELYSKVDQEWVEFGFELSESITIPVYSGSITPNYITL